mmetsp:Transcript_23061/g.68010  ORF Transcript_23061/g.68010 Transcript_23061/m.68010 type:complete len:228 (-) Transcript_23061:270-953(-)
MASTPSAWAGKASPLSTCRSSTRCGRSSRTRVPSGLSRPTRSDRAPRRRYRRCRSSRGGRAGSADRTCHSPRHARATMQTASSSPSHTGGRTRRSPTSKGCSLPRSKSTSPRTPPSSGSGTTTGAWRKTKMRRAASRGPWRRCSSSRRCWRASTRSTSGSPSWSSSTCRTCRGSGRSSRRGFRCSSARRKVSAPRPKTRRAAPSSRSTTPPPPPWPEICSRCGARTR